MGIVSRKLSRLTLPLFLMFLWQTVGAAQQPNRLDAALIAAIQKADVAAARTLLDQGASPNARDIPENKWERARSPHPPTALMLAAKEGNVALVKLLLDRGADVNAWGDDGYSISGTPLILAEAEHHTEIAQLLLMHGANVNARDRDGETALCKAAFSDDTILEKLLLARGARVDARTKDGRTPLAVAAISGNVDLARLLLDDGADVNTRDDSGYTPLIAAASEGKADIISLLVEQGADVNARSPTGETALLLAARIGQTGSIRFLLNHGANINAGDKSGWTPLMEAAANEHLDAVTLFIERGANVYARDNRGRTVLIAAAMLPFGPPFNADPGEEAFKIVKMALERGVNVNSADRDGRTALMEAVQIGSPAIVRLLLDHGADVNARDRDGDTPLLSAAFLNQTDNIRLLLDRGTRVNVRDKDGWTPLLRAAYGTYIRPQQKDESIQSDISLLVQHGADVKARDKSGVTALMWTAQRGSLDSVRLLLERGADPNVKDNEGWPVLKWAIQSDNVEVVRALLDKGADIEEQDGAGRAALMLAAAGKPAGNLNESDQSLDIVRLLLERGANIAARDKEGKTPLMQAADYGSVDIVRMLLRHGAVVHAKDKDGWTALTYARGRQEIVQALQQAGAREEKESLSSRPVGTSATFYVLRHTGTQIHLLHFAQADGVHFALTADDPILNLERDHLEGQTLQRAVLSPQGTWLAIGTDNSDPGYPLKDNLLILTVLNMANHRIAYQMQQHGWANMDWFRWRSDNRLNFVRFPDRGDSSRSLFSLSGPAWKGSERRVQADTDYPEALILSRAAQHRIDTAEKRIQAAGRKYPFVSLGIHGGESYFPMEGYEGAIAEDGRALAAMVAMNDARSPDRSAIHLLLMQAAHKWALQLVPEDAQKRFVDRVWFWNHQLVMRTRLLKLTPGSAAEYMPDTERICMFRLDDLT